MWGLFFPIGIFLYFFSLYSGVDPCRVVSVDILASVELEGIFRGISSRVFFFIKADQRPPDGWFVIAIH